MDGRSPATGTSGVVWSCRYFDELDKIALYRILQLRAEVFIVEQTCYYQDLDDKDQSSWHLAGIEGDMLVAYARLLPKGTSYTDAVSIGRVITKGSHRGTGLGKDMMVRAIDLCTRMWPGEDIRISAQSYLHDFYGSFGFRQSGEEYLEDGIPHIPMVRISR